MQPRPRILLVDDEPNVLESLTRGLRSGFEVLTATSAADGLAVLEEHADVAVVMSDMRMPLMNGTEFLAKVRAVAPDVVRMLLTGQADMDDAIAAINEGRIFRFLKKPCPPPTVREALGDAVEQYRLVTAERVLLERTLRGAVEALCSTLALANPAVFGMATRVKRYASAIATRLGLPNVWEIEVAAMVCQLGAITLPTEVFERRAHRGGLVAAERQMFERVPIVTEQLLAPIPRLEGVLHIVRHCRAPVGVPPRVDVPIGSLVLKVSLDFEELEAEGVSAANAVREMEERSVRYHPRALAALASLYETRTSTAELPIGALREGMVIAADIFTRNGTLLIARGHTVTPGLVDRLENFADSLAVERVRVERHEA